MITLPNEIIGEIIDAVDERDDVRSLRLTCKTLAEIGARKLFEELYISTLPDSLWTFFQITEHPTYGKYVKRICYDVVTLKRYNRAKWECCCLRRPEGLNPDDIPPPPDIRSFDGPRKERLYRDAEREWRDKHRAKNFYTEEQKNLAFCNYNDRLEDIAEVERDDDRFLHLGDALIRLSNLQEIKLFNRGHPLDGEETPSMYGFTWVLSNNVQIALPFDNDHISEFGHHGLILRVIGHPKVKIKTFRTQDIRWTAFDEAYGHIPLDMELPPAFARLNRIEMSFIEPWYEMDLALKMYREEMLGSLLRQAPDLEELSLRFGEPRDAFESRFDHNPLAPMRWKRIVRNNTWPRLRKLSLMTVDMKEKHIADFMRRHSSTLKELDLEDIFLLQGTWDSTFRQFKKTLNLEKVGFQGILGVSDPGSLEFNPEFHLPMTDHCDLARNRFLDLGTKEPLHYILKRYFLEEGNDSDPLKFWGHGMLPEGVVWKILYEDRDL